MKSAKFVFTFREKVKVNEQVDALGNISSSVNSIAGVTLNHSGGIKSHPVKNIIMSLKDGDPCSPWANDNKQSI